MSFFFFMLAGSLLFVQAIFNPHFHKGFDVVVHGHVGVIMSTLSQSPIEWDGCSDA